MAGLLVYGYPVLGVTLMTAAAGLPLPSELTLVAAGALAAQGYLDVTGTGLLALVATVAGDLIGYSIGRYAGREVIIRYGGWIGLTPDRMVKAEALFDRWGGLSIVITSTVLAALSTAVNLLAGASRYRVRSYLFFDIPARAAWIAALLWFGFQFSGSLEAAASFISDLSGLLASGALVLILGFTVYRYWWSPTRGVAKQADPR